LGFGPVAEDQIGARSILTGCQGEGKKEKAGESPAKSHQGLAGVGVIGTLLLSGVAGKEEVGALVRAGATGLVSSSCSLFPPSWR
jgi:hypothetical protein